MTRQEAISEIQLSYDISEDAKDMAISALEAESCEDAVDLFPDIKEYRAGYEDGLKDGRKFPECEDAVSRKAMIDALDVLRQEHRYRIPGKGESYSEYNEAWQDALGRAETIIDDLPSVTSKQFADCDKMVCEDAVSRDAVRNAFWELFCNRPLDSDKYVISACEKAVMDLPSVTPKPRKGEWVPFLLPCVDGTAMHVWQCDQCETNQVIESNYCPDCGSYNGGDTDA